MSFRMTRWQCAARSFSSGERCLRLVKRPDTLCSAHQDAPEEFDDVGECVWELFEEGKHVRD